MGLDPKIEEEEFFDHIEFETKYEVEESILHPFKELVEALDFNNFLYVEGPDVFFTVPGRGDLFARYRKATNDKKAEAWFTLKLQHSDKNNIKRTEPNWRVDKTPLDTIKIGAELMGFYYNTTIWKACHIYNLDDATLVFYTVRDEDSKYNHFIEIEVREDLKITEKEAWGIIEKYEKILAPLGIKAQKRKRLSLFQMYRKKDGEEKS